MSKPILKRQECNTSKTNKSKRAFIDYEDGFIPTIKRAKAKPQKNVSHDDDQQFVDEKLSRKILQEARKQQQEIDQESALPFNDAPARSMTKLGSSSAVTDSDSDADPPSDDEDYMDCLGENINEEDEAALERFMCPRPTAQASLGDILKDKISEKYTEISSQMSDDSRMPQVDLDERVVAMYKQIKEILSKYRSGKLPKAFKVIPALRNWEQILYLTGPDTWSAAAIYQAARLFSSNLKVKMAQRFYNLVLLPRMRDDITEYKRLNYHIYQALKRSLFKPAAFFKGILLPLCEAGNCTLREAIILSSIISKNSIPMLHSAAVMLKIAEMPYNGANSIFLRALIDKKYALPYRVIDALVFHFLQFERDQREMPVLWHQSLLAFAQRYKEDISSEQKSAILNLLRHQIHVKITPEIRRELVESKCRDEETAAPIDVD